MPIIYSFDLALISAIIKIYPNIISNPKIMLPIANAVSFVGTSPEPFNAGIRVEANPPTTITSKKPTKGYPKKIA